MHFRNTILMILGISTIFLSTCVSTKAIHTSVDSFAQADAIAKKRYFLLPGVKGVEPTDLQFQEFASYINNVLIEKGFVKAINIQDAELIIFLNYGIGDPQTSGFSTYPKIDTITHTDVENVYTRFLIIEAYESSTYEKNNKKNQVWKIRADSIGDSDDLRRVIPYMVIAIKQYIGTNTGRKVKIEVPLKDPSVELLREGQISLIK